MFGQSPTLCMKELNPGTSIRNYFNEIMTVKIKWVEVFKNGPSKICERLLL